MNIKFVTHSGSVYEVDQDNKQVRRLMGVKDPTPRQGKDGEWRKYDGISPIKVGAGVLICWTDDVALLKDNPFGVGVPGTMTSMVKEIIVEN